MPGWANAYVATGHGAEGLLLGPYSALTVARSILGIETSGDPIERALTARILDRFAPERFSSVQPGPGGNRRPPPAITSRWPR
jgi:glycine/D-amino acid oxidase-like deaminating enzyme